MVIAVDAAPFIASSVFSVLNYLCHTGGLGSCINVVYMDFYLSGKMVA